MPITLEIRSILSERAVHRLPEVVVHVRSLPRRKLHMQIGLFFLTRRRDYPRLRSEPHIIYESISAFEQKRNVPPNRRFNPRLRPRKTLRHIPSKDQSFISVFIYIRAPKYTERQLYK